MRQKILKVEWSWMKGKENFTCKEKLTLAIWQVLGNRKLGEAKKKTEGGVYSHSYTEESHCCVGREGDWNMRKRK